jgi:hypothetical protein
MNSETASPAEPAAFEPPSGAPMPAPKVCANCGAPMHGPFCHACGQPEKGMIRHLASVLADVADTIFNVDSRIFRSIAPLYFRPGFLTLEYFAGRRTRYVTPFRLFFFMCVISFFAIQISLNLDELRTNLVGTELGGIDHAQSQEELHKLTKASIDGLLAAQNDPEVPAAAKAVLQKSIDAIQKNSGKRLAWLKARDEALARNEKAPAAPNNEEETISFDGVPWDPSAHPLRISWLPAFANARLNETILHVKDNLIAAKRDPRHLIAGVFSVLPQTLFVLMPLFAVLLKITYVFKRRLYMEHLMVALHSHAFICMSLLLLAIVHLSIGAAASGAPWLVAPLQLARTAIWTWLPIYLFLMQKRVYQQGWF